MMNQANKTSSYDPVRQQETIRNAEPPGRKEPDERIQEELIID